MNKNIFSPKMLIKSSACNFSEALLHTSLGEIQSIPRIFVFSQFIYLVLSVAPSVVGVAQGSLQIGKEEVRRDQKGVDIVIKTIGRPTVRVGLFICRDEGGREVERRVRGVYRRQNIRGGPTEFAAGRNFIYTYSEPPS